MSGPCIWVLICVSGHSTYHMPTCSVPSMVLRVWAPFLCCKIYLLLWGILLSRCLWKVTRLFCFWYMFFVNLKHTLECTPHPTYTPAPQEQPGSGSFPLAQSGLFFVLSCSLWSSSLTGFWVWHILNHISVQRNYWPASSEPWLMFEQLRRTRFSKGQGRKILEQIVKEMIYQHPGRMSVY